MILKILSILTVHISEKKILKMILKQSLYCIQFVSNTVDKFTGETSFPL